MSTSMTLTAKGQFTFNKQLLDHINVKAGDKIIIKKLPDKSLKIEAEKSQLDILELAGSILTNIHLTNEEIEKSIQEGYVDAGIQGLK